MAALILLVRRELRLALRQGGDAAMVVAFFVLAVVLFPFGVGPEPQIPPLIPDGVLIHCPSCASVVASKANRPPCTFGWPSLRGLLSVPPNPT